MTKRSDLPTHSEIEETVEKNDDEMSEKIEELEVLTEDTETVRDARDALQLETSADGAEELESLVDAAEDETIEIFEGEDSNLEDIQTEAGDYASELDERHGSAESDLGELSDASGRIETSETVNRLADAKVSVLQEMDFLGDNNQKAEDAREESEQAQQELNSRINSGRR